jgi:hypothetical protein
MEEIFENFDSKFFKKILEIDRAKFCTDEQYVDWQIKMTEQMFKIDRGASDAKKANLGDIKSTKIESPFILSHPLYDPKLPEHLKATTLISGNIKAIVPIMREKFKLEYDKEGSLAHQRYKKTNTSSIKEKRIFGILTAR